MFIRLRKALAIVPATTIALVGASGVWATCDPGYITDCPMINPSILRQGVADTTMVAPLTILDVLSRAGGAETSRTSLGVNGQTGLTAQGRGNRWHGWLGYAHNNFSNDFAPMRSGGSVDVPVGGLDYTFGNNAILGVAVAFDRTRLEATSFFNNVDFHSDGYSISPYFSYPISRSLSFNATLGFGRAEFDAVDRNGGGAGSASDDRTFGALGLSYYAQFGKLLLNTRANYLRAEDKIDAYPLTNGNVVPSTTTRLGQVRLGAQLGYAADGWMPYVGATYINDTERPNQIPVGGVNAANDRDAWNFAIGVNFAGKGVVSGGIMYSKDTSRRESNSEQFLANIGIRF